MLSTSCYSTTHRGTVNIFLVLIFAYFFYSCGGLKKPKSVEMVVRPSPRTIVTHPAKYTILNHRNNIVIKEDTTNCFGYFVIPKKKGISFNDMEVRISYTDSTQHDFSTHIRLNEYVGLYDVYLSPIKQAPKQDRVADFHYHVSMKPHNSFGQFLYPDERSKKKRARYVKPDSIAIRTLGWQKLRGNLQIYHKSRWSNVQLKSAFENVDEKEKMKTFLEGKWVRSKDGSNNFKHFTEATTPHSIDGNVYLAFNAISPFEHSVSNDGVKRAVSSALKTGANINWLRMMGDKNRFITHWSNFNKEYDLINKQITGFNNYTWRILKKGEPLSNAGGIPVVVNVVEGGHILQDKYFPHFVNFDLMDSAVKVKGLFEYIQRRAETLHDTEVAKRMNKIDDMPDSIDTRKLKATVVDSILITELIRNVDSLKKMDIHMIAISHLSYNGMTGHSPALDVSQRPFKEKIFSWIAQRAYSISTSNDMQYRKAYDGLFYRVPGVNAYGDTVISRLLDPNRGGRILIDLKHSDVITRRYLFNKMDSLSKTTIEHPPICSHCAVNGLTIDYTSPLLNEYRMRNSKLARKFYPFAINLYNEEVKMICERGGIIGIPLEERVLGGFINNKVEYPVTLKHKANSIIKIPTQGLSRRNTFILNTLAYLRQENKKVLNDVLAFYMQEFKGIGETDAYKLVVHDYCSAEPFMQNLFHVIDIAHLAKKKSIQEERIVKAVGNVRNEQANEGRAFADSTFSQKILENVERLAAAAPPIVDPYSSSWKYVCLGSDMDGLIDPINICSSASNYPFFKAKLEKLIPLFLYIRKNFEGQDKLLGSYREYEDYFSDATFPVRDALDLLFYKNLYDFTAKHFTK